MLNVIFFSFSNCCTVILIFYHFRWICITGGLGYSASYPSISLYLCISSSSFFASYEFLSENENCVGLGFTGLTACSTIFSFLFHLVQMYRAFTRATKTPRMRKYLCWALFMIYCTAGFLVDARCRNCYVICET